MTNTLAKNHKRIWLDALCCVDERCWHEARPKNCIDCELAPIEYVRADLPRMEIEQLKAKLAEIASQCHNLPRSATADRIEQLATGKAEPASRPAQEASR